MKALSAPVVGEFVSVESAGCRSDCGVADVDRLHVSFDMPMTLRPR
jgi:hypothetical protein